MFSWDRRNKECLRLVFLLCHENWEVLLWRAVSALALVLPKATGCIAQLLRLLLLARGRPRGQRLRSKEHQHQQPCWNLTLTLRASIQEGTGMEIQHLLKSSVAEIPRGEIRRTQGFGVAHYVQVLCWVLSQMSSLQPSRAALEGGHPHPWHSGWGHWGPGS